MSKETKALARGLFIAVSNASVKKGKGTTPKEGTKKAANGDWVQGRELTVTYFTKSGWKTVPAKDWIEKLKQKDHTITYTANNGKPRKKKVSSYKIIPLDHNEPPKIIEHQLWRKGSTGNLPNSWGGDGLVNYYIRKNWRTEIKGNAVIAKISPGKIPGKNSNERVLHLLDEGGTALGSRPLIGFTLVFNGRTKDGRRRVFVLREYGQKPTVRLKAYNIKHQIVVRINRIIRKIKPSQISNQHWRQIGAGKY